MVIKGIDISSQTNNINIEKLKAENIKFVMLRAGFTDYDKNKTKNIDINFNENYKLFKKNKFKIGVYYTFLATTIKEAKEELDYFISIIKDKVFEYPVVIQIEDNHNTIIYHPESQNILDNNVLLYVTNYIYRELYKHGYKVLIRTYENWYYNVFDKSDDYNYWIDNVKDKNNLYLFYSKEDDIIYYNQNKSTSENVEIVLNENCFFETVLSYIKAGYKILKSKIRKK